MSDKRKSSVEHAQQSAEKHEDRLAAAGTEAEKVVHDLALKSGERLAQERDHRAG